VLLLSTYTEITFLLISPINQNPSAQYLIPGLVQLGLNILSPVKFRTFYCACCIFYSTPGSSMLHIVHLVILNGGMGQWYSRSILPLKNVTFKIQKKICFSFCLILVLRQNNL
jgi:hypothetical protein